MQILVLGGTGSLGTLVSDRLATRGVAVRAVGRRDGDARDPETIIRLAAGATAIVNCAGASVALGLSGWRGYRAVDTRIGLAAVEAANRTGARLVYVAVHYGDAAVARCAYVDAHERVVAAMSTCKGTAVRSTGLFSAYAALLPYAQRGVMIDVGAGTARTNPIGDADIASIVADEALSQHDGLRTISAGGPQVLARREIFEHVVARAGRAARFVRMPTWFANLYGIGLRVVHPRLGQFMRFAALIGSHDIIAPARGTALRGLSTRGRRRADWEAVGNREAEPELRTTEPSIA
ncbi:MAG: SDR family oxidoreductase [Kofleriaceae bacterium]